MNVGTAELSIRATSEKLVGDLRKIKAQAERETSARVDVKVGAKADSSIVGELEKIRARIDAAKAQVDIGVSSVGALTEIGRLEARLAAVGARRADVQVTAETGVANRDLVAVETRLAALDGKRVDVEVGVDRSGAGFASISDGLGSLTRQAGVAAAAVGAIGAAAGGFALNLIGQLEQVKVGFAGVLGSTGAAEAFTSELQEFAARTPFEFDQLTKSAQTLIGTFGAGFRSEVVPTLTAIGNVAATLGQGPAQIEGVIRAISQIEGKGKVASQELNQIAEQFPGFNARAVLAAEAGVSVAEMMTRIESGGLSADEGIRLLIAGMENFNGAAGAMDRQALTLVGRLSTLKDNLKIAVIEGFEPLNTVASSALDGFAASLTGGQIGGAIRTLGTSIANGFNDIVPALDPFLAGLTSGLGSAFEGLGAGLAPFLVGIGQIAPAFGDLLGVVLELAGSIAGPLLSAATPMVTIFARLADSVLGPIADGFQTLGPLVSDFSTQLVTALDESGGFEEISTAVAELVTELTPLAVELIPVLTRAIPGVVAGFVAMAEAVVFVADATGETVRLIRSLADEFGFVSSAVGAAVDPFGALHDAVFGSTADLENLGAAAVASATDITFATGMLGGVFDPSVSINAAAESVREELRATREAADAFNLGDPLTLDVSEISPELAELVGGFDQVTALADAFGDAMDRLNGRTLSLAEVRSEIEATKDALAADFSAQFGFDFDAAEGRKNFDLVKAQFEALGQQADIQLAAGIDADQVAKDFDAGQLQLIAQVAAELNVDPVEAAARLQELGLLAPIQAVLDGAAFDAAKAEIDGLLAEEQVLPVEVQALVDDGRYVEAQTLLRSLTRTQEVKVNASLTPFALVGVKDQIDRLAFPRTVPLNATFAPGGTQSQIDAAAAPRTVRYTADVSAVTAELDRLQREADITVRVRTRTIGTQIPLAQGGEFSTVDGVPVRHFRAGGIPDAATAGPARVSGPSWLAHYGEAGHEYFIPAANDGRRPRAKEMVHRAVEEFGMGSEVADRFIGDRIDYRRLGAEVASGVGRVVSQAVVSQAPNVTVVSSGDAERDGARAWWAWRNESRVHSGIGGGR